MSTLRSCITARTRQSLSTFLTGSHSALARRWTHTTPPGSPKTSRSVLNREEYRSKHFVENKIELRTRLKGAPYNIARLADLVRQVSDKPGPCEKDLLDNPDYDSLFLGTNEAEVETYYSTQVFPAVAGSRALTRSIRYSLRQETVPNLNSKFKISRPAPDLLYGYKFPGAFSQSQHARLGALGLDTPATTQLHHPPFFPFFPIEFKGESGKLYVAVNQCVGGSVACVHLMEQLKAKLQQHATANNLPNLTNLSNALDTAAFSVAMNGTTAFVFITWRHYGGKEEPHFIMAPVETFTLHSTEDYREFYSMVQNTVSWGAGERLRGIRACLDVVRIEQARGKSVEERRGTGRRGSSSGAATKTAAAAGGHQRRMIEA
ncbi:uncharacterized protein C8A04DRAFT_27129 [Dichotomopilus funicola]|uniref:DUF7924 domain-containing protein n=1 Tax=Dichotomopilus funicola TaxID=1934379 RepID=A0AAN6V583_9PEZI|nr:hypothetical protein C8A04DRAFT_27129 [Dichotomopilus funicola]